MCMCMPLCVQVRLVLEKCDMGNLEQYLLAGGLRASSGPGGSKPDMPAVVKTALDVAHAMQHLHAENVIHGDLKVCVCVLDSSSPAGH